MRKFLLIACCISLVVSSCNIINGNKTITGNGIIVSRSYDIENFKDVDVSSSVTVVLTQGTDFDVKLEGDDNIVPVFQVKLVGEKLVIKPKDNYNLSFKKSVKAYVTAPEFRKLEASGASNFLSKAAINYDGKMELDLSGSSDADLELNAAKIDAEVSGACKLSLRGVTKEFKVDGSGSSVVKCFDLQADIVSIDFSGAGAAEVSAAQKLKLDISGAANIKYKGNPAITQDVSGAASVSKVE